MWDYAKKLQYPVKIKNPDPVAAKIIMTQLGGPDGEMGAATRYLNQRYTMPYKECKAILTDIGTEECAPVSYQSDENFGCSVSVRSVEARARMETVLRYVTE